MCLLYAPINEPPPRSAARCFRQQLVPVLGHDADGALLPISQDIIRVDANLAGLSQLKPAFDPVHGTLTAGNSSALSDGAAALLIMSAEHAHHFWDCNPWRGSAQRRYRLRSRAHGLRVGTGCRSLWRAGLQMTDIDLPELNEAFAAQKPALPARIATGRCYRTEQSEWWRHSARASLGCSGARILTSLVYLTAERQASLGLATMCIGLGQGIKHLEKYWSRTRSGLPGTATPESSLHEMAF